MNEGAIEQQRNLGPPTMNVNQRTMGKPLVFWMVPPTKNLNQRAMGKPLVFRMVCRLSMNVDVPKNHEEQNLVYQRVLRTMGKLCRLSMNVDASMNHEEQNFGYQRVGQQSIANRVPRTNPMKGKPVN